MNRIKVNGTQNFMGINIPIIEGGFGEGCKSVIANTIADIHNTRLDKVNELINNNINEFEEGIDIIDLLSDENSLNLAKGLGFITNNRQKNCYLLSEQGYMLLVGFMKTEKSKQIRKKLRREYFSMRKIIKEVITPQLPTDYLTALKALLQSEEQKALMQPQVEYYQKVLNPNSESEQQGYVKYVTVTAIAKDLHMSAQKLNKTLNELHIIYKQGKTWYLYAEHEDRVPEYADYIINEHGQTLKFSEKGREWIIKLLEENEVINIAS